MENSWDVIVAGGGPAGLSAALMLGRARRRVLVVDAGRGRNRFAEHMHGVLGAEGMPPAEFRERGRAEAAAYGVEFADAEIASVDRTDGGLRAELSSGELLSARALIVATGLTDRLPEIPGLAERWGRTVLHCPYCHGWEVRGERLAVLATSPLSMHQAEMIRQWSDRLTVFTEGLGDLSDETKARLRSRGLRLEDSAVVEVRGDGDAISSVALADGQEVAVDAIFTFADALPHDGFLAPLGLERRDTPLGSFLAVDEMGRTSDERVWAAGNVVNPGANVPKSMGDGSFAGAAVNGALVGWEFDEAAGGTWPQVASAELWEERYAEADRVWSHSANAVLADVAAGLEPGTALDLGSGEGADVIWLAQHGWHATGVDISPTAAGRAAEAAEAAGVAAGAVFVAGDVRDQPDGAFDLVTSSFLHSPAEIPREDLLREAANKVAPGGHLLITSHAGAPTWAPAHAGHHTFLPPAEEHARLGLDAAEWELVLCETRERELTSPAGEAGTVDDGVLLIRRR
ncbi:SAM-dependent methyltransferase [Microbacterium halophytorum]|uniref:SAM-dependent methyltransferase n=1 Tax=Microbacterium halophytorum TaxID=2067568 RepID=UPI000CFC1C93|nr:SAM-dependent methyltransferase [Microbacterium halophytorum]